MDTSKGYIDMCEAASEIQDVWKPSRADFIKGDFVGYIQDVSIVPSIVKYAINPLGEDSEVGRYAWYFQNELVWLPSQDQLQDMTGWCMADNVMQSAEFFEQNESKIGSMEQLWLAFVMKEKYNKKWNGEEWTSL